MVQSVKKFCKIFVIVTDLQFPFLLTSYGPLKDVSLNSTHLYSTFCLEPGLQKQTRCHSSIWGTPCVIGKTAAYTDAYKYSWHCHDKGVPVLPWPCQRVILPSLLLFFLPFFRVTLSESYQFFVLFPIFSQRTKNSIFIKDLLQRLQLGKNKSMN